jgi:hypothetical protein
MIFIVKDEHNEQRDKVNTALSRTLHPVAHPLASL